jgi:crotonobetainyl-CoA:carnitine CoA-transferase CaiB-like acyl-CoA transferase
MGAAIQDYFTTGRIAARCGNDDREAAPHGAYPCMDGKWVALSCWSDSEFATLAEVLGNPELADDERFAGADARHRNARQLEELISAWTGQHGAVDVAETLQAAGLAAYPVVTVGDLFSDPQLGARHHWRVRRHPEIGDQTYCFPGFDLEETPGDIVSAAPRLGADNDFVFRDLVGVSGAEMQTFTDNGVFG